MEAASDERHFVGGKGAGGGGTQSFSLPSWAQPYAQGLGQAAFQQGGLSLGPNGSFASFNPQAFPGMEVAPLNRDQNQAIGAIEQMGTSNPLNTATQNQLTATEQGKYLDPSTNPQLKGYFNAANAANLQNYKDAVAPDILTRAIQNGTPYSSGTAQAYADARNTYLQNSGNLAAQIYEPAYQQERSNQMYAAQLTPQTVSSQYIPANMLMGAGNVQQQQQQNQLNAKFQNSVNSLEWPFNVLSILGQLLGQSTAGQGTVKTTE